MKKNAIWKETGPHMSVLFEGRYFIKEQNQIRELWIWKNGKIRNWRQSLSFNILF